MCPAPEPVFGIAAPQGRETPAGAGRRMVASNEAQKRARGPAPEFALKELRTSPGAPELPSAARKFGVGFRPANGAKQLFFQKSSANLTTKVSDPIK